MLLVGRLGAPYKIELAGGYAPAVPEKKSYFFTDRLCEGGPLGLNQHPQPRGVASTLGGGRQRLPGGPCREELHDDEKGK